MELGKGHTRGCNPDKLRGMLTMTAPSTVFTALSGQDLSGISFPFWKILLGLLSLHDHHCAGVVAMAFETRDSQ
jgi:hypothetical protein